MATSLSVIVGLLTTALSLLTLVQQNPNLPQSSRDTAQQMAESAITQATSLLLNSQSSPTTTATSSEEVEVEVKLEKITVTESSAQISWKTNIPVASKITVTKTPAQNNKSTAQYLPSANGVSTKGIVSVVGLTQNTEYSYTIEADNAGKTVELNGKFITEKSAEQTAKEESEAWWYALPTCPVRDGSCRTNSTYTGTGCIYQNGRKSQCGDI